MCSSNLLINTHLFYIKVSLVFSLKKKGELTAYQGDMSARYTPVVYRTDCPRGTRKPDRRYVPLSGSPGIRQLPVSHTVKKDLLSPDPCAGALDGFVADALLRCVSVDLGDRLRAVAEEKANDYLRNLTAGRFC